MLNNFIEYVKQNWQNRPATATPITAERLEHIENGIKSNSDALKEIKRTFLDAVYPVGSIYMSVSSANPSEIFGGGTWERIKDRFLLAAGDTYSAGNTGGEATHKLSTAEMPEHTHLLAKAGISSSGMTFTQYSAYQGEDSITAGQYWWADTTASGNSQTHNNMPPYLTVYIWKRTA